MICVIDLNIIETQVSDKVIEYLTSVSNMGGEMAQWTNGSIMRFLLIHGAGMRYLKI